MNLTEIIIDEKRAIEQQSESPMTIVLSYIQKYGFDNVFISFRESVNTSSINKNNRYDTPTGFYAYPLPFYFKNRNLSEMTWSDFVSKFPFAGNREYAYIFTIRDKSNVVFTSAPNKAQINDYVTKIKEIYGKSTTGYSQIANLCDAYIAGTWRSDYGGFAEGNEVRKFWLFLYAIAELLRAGQRLSNTVSIIARKIGLLGVCDDAGLGVIHVNEKAQIVLFYGFMNIIGDYRILSSHYERQDVALPIDKQKDRNDTYTNRFNKFLGFVEKKMGLESGDVRFSIDYMEDKDAARYFQQLKAGRSIPVKIKTNVNGTSKFIPYFINSRFQIGLQDISLYDIDKLDSNDVNIQRAAFLNTLHPDNAKLMRCGEFGEFGNKDIAVGTMIDSEGYDYYAYVDKKGNPITPNVNVKQMSGAELITYFNTLAGTFKFRNFGMFREKNGKELAIGYYNKHSAYPFYFNEKGEVDSEGFGEKLNINSYLDIAAAINSKARKFILTREGLHALETIDNHFMIKYGDEDDNDWWAFFDVYGNLDLKGIDVDNLDQYQLAGYYNQLNGISKIKLVHKTEIPNILLVEDYEGDEPYFINKFTGEPTIDGIDPNYNKAVYDTTKYLVDNNMTLEKMYPKQNTGYELDEGQKKLINIINEVILNFLT